MYSMNDFNSDDILQLVALDRQLTNIFIEM